MNDLQIFSSNEFGMIRTLEIDGEPWFVGRDVAISLGYRDTDQAIRKHIDSEDKLTRQFDGSGQNRNMTIINESGLYSLIFSSKLDSAKRFKHWVTSEVLPAIRKTGSYRKEDDTRKWLATLIIDASEEKLEYIRRLYPEYLGSKPVISNNSNHSYEEWSIDVDENYICSMPTTRLYSDYVQFCTNNSLAAIGKKTFYKNIETEYGLTRMQKHNGYRYFI
jgi:prophage antirepressor-like protein